MCTFCKQCDKFSRMTMKTDTSHIQEHKDFVSVTHALSAFRQKHEGRKVVFLILLMFRLLCNEIANSADILKSQHFRKLGVNS